MFSENTKKTGCIEVICGSMFSGKTEELIRRLKRAQFAKQKIEIFKPTIDKRYSDLDVVSHDSHTIPCTPIKTPSRMLNVAPDVEVIGIDEAQFFDESIIEVAQTLANRGVRVIVAGLDTDYLGKPFGPMPGLMAIAEDVQKVHAICVRCGKVMDVGVHEDQTLDAQATADLRPFAEGGYPWTVYSHATIFQGLCPECAAKEQAEKEASATA